MTQTATVVGLEPNGKAVIMVKRVSACGENCAHCAAKCADRSNELKVLADNAAGADVGDIVEVESSAKKILGFAALVYLVPVLLFVAGAVISALCGFSDGMSALVCVAAFLFGVTLAVVYNKKVASNKEICHTIVKIVK